MTGGQRAPIEGGASELTGGENGGERGSTSGAEVHEGDPVQVTSMVIATYNIQNLFDLEDDPDHFEGDYTPGSSNWNANSFQAKLDAISQVIEDIDADLIGLQEVESESALRALADRLRARGVLDYPHLSLSPTGDPRGIAIGILSRYPLKRAVSRPISQSYTCASGAELTGSPPEARPIFEVNLWGSDDDYQLTLLFNHWKSRASDDGECRVAEHHQRGGEQIQGLMSQWMADDPQRAVLVLGDFNAQEVEPSLTTALDTALDRMDLLSPSSLYNLWGDLGVGQPGSTDNVTNSTYYFDQRWQRLDHIFVSRPMINGQGDWSVSDFEVIYPPYAIRNGRPYSWRLSAAEGYSDHLPIRVQLNYDPHSAQ
jgi:endonuclease/exonuclease/phosphatase family metal-dependent hydrolase